MTKFSGGGGIGVSSTYVAKKHMESEMAAGDHKKNHAGLPALGNAQGWYGPHRWCLKPIQKHFKDCPGIRYEPKPMAEKCVYGAHLVPLPIGLPGSDQAFEAEVLSDYRRS